MKINFTHFKSFITLFAVLLPFLLSANISYKGQVVYPNKNRTPLKGVNVMLKDKKGEIVASTLSDEFGNFEFTNITEGKYIIDGSYDAETGDIDLSDLYLILEHLLGVKQLEGIAYLAADVDGSGFVDWNDYWHFLVDYLIFDQEFKVGKWVFLSHELKITSSVSKDGPQELIGGSGDTGGDFEPGVKENPVGLSLRTDGYVNSLNGVVEIPVYYTGLKNIGGGYFNINISKDINVKEVVSSLEGLKYNVNQDFINISWMNVGNTLVDFNEPLFTVKVTTDDLSQLESVLSIGDESHLIDSEGNKMDGAELSMPAISNNEEEIAAAVLYDICPNPIRDNANIRYTLNETAKVKLTVYSISGQKVAELVNAVQSPNEYTLPLNIDEYNLTNGMYVYRLDCVGESTYSESKMMIISK